MDDGTIHTERRSYTYILTIGLNRSKNYRRIQRWSSDGRAQSIRVVSLFVRYALRSRCLDLVLVNILSTCWLGSGCVRSLLILSYLPMLSSRGIADFDFGIFWVCCDLHGLELPYTYAPFVTTVRLGLSSSFCRVSRWHYTLFSVATFSPGLRPGVHRRCSGAMASVGEFLGQYTPAYLYVLYTLPPE
jgi:hypothetical protein